MEVRVTGVQAIRGNDARPLSAGGFCGGEVFAGTGAVPVVKFVGGDAAPGITQKIIFVGCQGHIAKAGELAGVKALPGQKAHHFFFSDFLRQVHKAAALRNAGQSTHVLRNP